MRIDDADKITYEDAKAATRRGMLYLAALQANDGHWPAENSGTMFFNGPFVSCKLPSAPEHLIVTFFVINILAMFLGKKNKKTKRILNYSIDLDLFF